MIGDHYLHRCKRPTRGSAIAAASGGHFTSFGSADSATCARRTMTSDGPDAKKQKSDDDWRRTSFKIADVNPHLVCALCGGYFRDCHTITECLHSFCQVCILAHLRQNKNSCPRCGVDLGPHPMTAVLHDRQLQAVVDKIFPEFEDIDRQARQARRSLEAPPSAPRARRARPRPRARPRRRSPSRSSRRPWPRARSRSPSSCWTSPTSRRTGISRSGSCANI